MAKFFTPDAKFQLELVRSETTTKRDEAGYRLSPALNQSYLKDVNAVSPSYAEYRRLNPEETPALIFGSALHTLVLEPNDFNKRYAMLPDCDRRTKEGKALFEEFAIANAGKRVLKSTEVDSLIAMAKKSRPFFDEKKAKYANHEVECSATFVVIDGEFKGQEVVVKAQFDAVYVFEDKVIIKDLKSVADITNVKGASFQNGWATQSAFYHDLAQFCYQKDTSFDYIAQSKSEPYDVREFGVSDEMFIKGRQSYSLAINKWLWWKANGQPDTDAFHGKETLNG